MTGRSIFIFYTYKFTNFFYIYNVMQCTVNQFKMHNLETKYYLYTDFCMPV